MKGLAMIAFLTGAFWGFVSYWPAAAGSALCGCAFLCWEGEK